MMTMSFRQEIKRRKIPICIKFGKNQENTHTKTTAFDIRFEYFVLFAAKLL